MIQAFLIFAAVAIVAVITRSVYLEFTRPSVADVAAGDELIQVQVLSPGQHLSGVDIMRGMHLLVQHAKKFRPDCIVGLNSGGILCGAYIASVLGIPDEKLFRKLVIPSTGVTRCNGTGLGGRILIVDDITRSGETLSLAKKAVLNEIERLRKLPQKAQDVTEIIEVGICTLVAATDERGIPLCTQSVFSTILTRDKEIRLPWSSQLGADTAQRMKNFSEAEGRKVEESFLLLHTKITANSMT